MKKTARIYLPEDLNITKMYQLFREKYPTAKCGYESYRKTIYNDLQVLKMFCSVEAQAYFDSLPDVKDSLHDTLPDESE